MSEQMSDKVWKMREVPYHGGLDIEIYEDYETTVSEGHAIVATLKGANHRPTQEAALLIVAAPKLLGLCQDVLREHKRGDGVPQEILERMLDEVLKAQL